MVERYSDYWESKLHEAEVQLGMFFPTTVGDPALLLRYFMLKVMAEQARLLYHHTFL